MRDSYKFAIITGAYNVEAYLGEFMQSLVSQDIGFEQNIQVILVDDGSTDSTGVICDKYAAMYPDNVFVIHQENSGVSAARNAGMELLRAEYVSFMDADDKFTPDVCSCVGDFFGKHGDEVDMVSVPMEFFEGATGGHILNYKFDKGTRVINLDEEPTCIQLSMSAAFTKAEALRGKKFDVRLQHEEDTKVSLSILVQRHKLGVVSTCRYLCRRRSAGTSAVQQSTHSSAWYLPHARYHVQHAINHLKGEDGRLPVFVQFTLMYSLQWRFQLAGKTALEVLTPEEFAEWKGILFSVLKEVDESVIRLQRNPNGDIKTFLLCKKYGGKAECVNTDDGVVMMAGGHAICNISQTPVYLRFLDAKAGHVILEANSKCFAGLAANGVKPVLRVGDKEYECSLVEGWTKEDTCLDEPMTSTFMFRGEVPFPEKDKEFKINVGMRIAGTLVVLKNLISCQYFPVPQIVRHGYCRLDRYLVTCSSGGLRFRPYGRARHFWHELTYMKSLFFSRKPGCRGAMFTRLLYWLSKPFMPKDIWLVCDRITKADDNGEALFRYIRGNRSHPHTYFILLKSSPDYARLSKIGPTLPHLSLKHLLYHLNASCIISSAADQHLTTYPKQKRGHYFVDLWYRRKFVFLQHGITKDDISAWLNHYNHNLHMMVTAAGREYDSIVGTPRYAMGPDVVKLTGFARFDRLEDKSEKLIVLAPTWRKSFANHKDYYKSGIVGVNEGMLLASEFFKFYSSLLNDDAIKQACEAKGYKIWFMPHPNLMPYIHLFKTEGYVVVAGPETSYRDVFSKGKMLITDYSSCAFDFAYLRKPVLYCQFDKTAFFSSQYGMGYFDYEKDGFGEVAYDLDAARKLILEYLGADFALKDTYRQRIDSFYAYNDRDNCKRVIENINKLFE